ncbi:MAG: hypothetical protein RDV48_23395 [Candidatus Eremiobacteraeota bacterium]|nr:hypothetical protein [Candidatus Eremiobacteraeota bacterium]
MRRERNGHTVIEMLVVLVILILLFWSVYRLLAPGLRAWVKSDSKVMVQQNALLGMYRLTNELKESNIYTVSLMDYNGHSLICCASSRDREGNLHSRIFLYGVGSSYDTGSPEWQKYIIFYLDDKSRIRRYETPVSPPATTFTTYRSSDTMRIAVDPASLINPSDTLSNKVIANKIKTLSILYNPSSGDWKGGLDISITAWDDEQDFETTLETTIGVRYDEWYL